MAVATYTVKRGDSLWLIASGGCGKNIANSISGSTVNAKINTLVELNDIPDRNLIYVGQVLKLSGTASNKTSSSTGSTSTSSASNKPVITALALESQDTTGRAMYAAWSFSKSNVKQYQVQWSNYRNGMWNAEALETIEYTSSTYRRSTYSAPEAATAVKVRVKAISGSSSWKDVWSAEKVYYFSENPPYPPDAPEITINNDNLTLTASINNIDATALNAKEVEFQLIKDNSKNLGTVVATINTEGYYVSCMFNVEAGGEYKVRARCKNGTKVSTWTSFSESKGTKPSAPTEIISCKANSYANDEITAYLEWTPVTNAETYNIEYATNKNHFDGTDQTTTINGITFTHHEISSLTLGNEYFFRVCAVNQNGESDWTEIKSVVVGTTPVAPTTWSSTTTAVVGEPLNLYWVHNCEDNSTQTYAELRLYVDDVLQSPDITVENDREEDEKDKTSVYALDTTDYPEGTQIKWQVRTAGATKNYGDWSIERVIDIYAKPTLELAVTTLPDGTGDIVDTLTSFPFYIYALPGPKTQAPIGYHLKVTANEYYETINDDGTTTMVNKGDSVYSKYFDTTNTLIVEMSADNLNIEADIEYTITCSVTMNSGLTTEVSHNFTASWDDVAYNLNAEVTINQDTLTASIIPYSEDENGVLVEDITLSVYRREYDGSLTEIARDIPNANSITVSDPHPALDYARYRIIGKTKSTGAVSYQDIAGVEVGGNSVIIQWNEEWTVFDASEEYDTEKPAWSGSLLSIPYNIDVSSNHSKETELVQYIGRKHPVTYYGTQLGETATWNVEIPTDDKDTLYAIRRLAIWTGDVYVREPSGSGYWANISVSYTKTHNEVTIPVTFTITRVEGGV